MIGVSLIFLIFGVLSAYVASEKGLNVLLWFVIGVLLGPFGMFAAWRFGDKKQKRTEEAHRDDPADSLEFQTLVKKLQHDYQVEQYEATSKKPAEFNPEQMTKKCPACGGRIKLKAMVCSYCQTSFDLTEVQNHIRAAWEEYKQQKS